MSAPAYLISLAIPTITTIIGGLLGFALTARPRTLNATRAANDSQIGIAVPLDLATATLTGLFTGIRGALTGALIGGLAGTIITQYLLQ